MTAFSLIIETAADRALQAAQALQAQIAAAIDAQVEAQAQSLGYNSAASCASYRESGVPAWAAEASAFIAWRDSVWQAAIALQLQHQQAGTVPTPAEALAVLPAWGG